MYDLRDTESDEEEGSLDLPNVQHQGDGETEHNGVSVRSQH